MAIHDIQDIIAYSTEDGEVVCPDCIGDTQPTDVYLENDFDGKVVFCDVCESCIQH